MQNQISRETQELYDDLVAHSIIVQERVESALRLRASRRSAQDARESDGVGANQKTPSHDAAVAGPLRWKDQREVDELQALLEEVLGTTFQVRQAARALLNDTQGNYARLHKILLEYKADRKFCDWAQRVGLRAFAFKGMALTRYHATPKRAASKDWYERNKQHINR